MTTRKAPKQPLPSPAQVTALEEVLTFCEDVEYRNGHTLRQARAAVRALRSLVGED